MIIKDGTGSGSVAKVTNEFLLRTLATMQSELSYRSESFGKAFSWAAPNADLGADKNIIWLRNDSPTENLIIDQVIVGCVATADIEVYVSTGSTVGGAAIVGTNLNRSSSGVALATCRSANTNVDAGAGSTLLLSSYCGVLSVILPLKGALVLGYLDEVSINIVTDIAGCNATIIGYYHSLAS